MELNQSPALYISLNFTSTTCLKLNPIGMFYHSCTKPATFIIYASQSVASERKFYSVKCFCADVKT